MIILKTKDEIELLKQAGLVVADVFEAVKDKIVPGVTTKELDDIVEATIRSHGAEPSFLGYGDPPFKGSACLSINEEVVHGQPSKDRVLKDGDIISVDVGAYLNGFHGDACRTYCCGNVDPEVRRLVKCAEDAFWYGMQFAKPGNRLGDISGNVQEFIEYQGFGVVRELTGHGIGRDLHEDPDLLNYGRKGRGVRLEEGMTLCLEPMITQGARYISMKSDGWTIVTRDGKAAAHYENSFAILADGPYVMTCSGYERPLEEGFQQPKSYAE